MTREQLVSFTAVTEEHKDLEASPHSGLQMNGLCTGCIQPQEVEDPVKTKDKNQEGKEECGEREK